jgi:hypothetical protein
MANLSAHDAAARINALADRSGWPLICDAHLEFATPQLHRLLEVWRDKRAGRLLPARPDLSIQDLKFIVGNIVFIDVVRQSDRTRFRVRLMGAELERYVAPMTGRFIDEAVSQQFASKWSAKWEAAIEARAPLRTVGRLEFRDQRRIVSENLNAPLAADGETPDIILSAYAFHVLDEQDGGPSDIAARLVKELGNRMLRERVA